MPRSVEIPPCHRIRDPARRMHSRQEGAFDNVRRADNPPPNPAVSAHGMPPNSESVVVSLSGYLSQYVLTAPLIVGGFSAHRSPPWAGPAARRVLQPPISASVLY